MEKEKEKEKKKRRGYPKEAHRKKTKNKEKEIKKNGVFAHVRFFRQKVGNPSSQRARHCTSEWTCFPY